MVRIAKGKYINSVPKSAYNNFFKSQGWVIVGEKSTPPTTFKEPVEPVKEVVKEDKGTEEEWDDSLEEWDDSLEELQDEEAEKPLSDMNKAELIAKAKSLGIYDTNLSTNKQLREAIKAHI